MTWKKDLFYLAYMLLFGASVAALAWWQKQTRKTRLPFGDEFKLLRGPGETQLRLARKSDDEAVPRLVWASVIPVTVGMLLLLLTVGLPEEMQIAGAAVALGGFIAALFFTARWFANKARESGNRYLGYFGERVVAEHLEPLKAQGWRIFHDVPVTAQTHKANLDHVAVGPAGVFAIETKTRRKGSARPGFDEHKAYFDGRSLVWPWGEDNHGLEQAERSASWLADMLQAETGERVPVTPILTLPGWVVEMKPSRDSRTCRVANPKELAKLLPAGATVLDARQIDAIAAKLEARCRDVEY